MKIGTRGSALALWQARTVARLIENGGGPPCEIVVIRTSGDEGSGPPDSPRSPENVKSTFVKEIEDALLQTRVDLAVHSAKDLPGALPEGLRIAAAIEREDPHDALLLPAASSAKGIDAVRAVLGAHPRIGTSSVRRAAELRALFAGASFIPIRGNVETRLRKLDAGECDALVLAVAGIKRLALEHRLSAVLPADVCVPAPGQGIVAVEVAEACSDDVRMAAARISDADAATALLAERAVVVALGGSCQMPLGALATIDGQDLTMHGVVASIDGRTAIRAAARGHRGGAAAVGEKLAAQLVAKGALELLK
jgi:hydroxymethylbilane synthase